MYKIFIVDDESIVREGIRAKIDWDKSIFAFSGEASDGEIALSMIQEIKPDILITDIKMPFMDGLELSMIVKKIQPWIKIIILTGHDEFEFAQKAISIGVDEYLLKPFSGDDLLQVIFKVARKIDHEKKQLFDSSLIQEKLESAMILAREHLVSELVLGTASFPDFYKQAEKMHIDIFSKYYIVCIFDIQTKENNKKELLQARLLISKLISDSLKSLSFTKSPNRIVCILKVDTENKIEDDSFSLAEAVVHEIKSLESCYVTVAIGSVVQDIADLLSSYQNAEHVLSVTIPIEKNMIVSYSDMCPNTQKNLVLEPRDPVFDLLRYATINEIDGTVESYISLLGENLSHFPVIASYLLVDLIFAISKLFEEYGGNLKKELPEILEHTFIEKAVKNEETLRHEIRKICIFFISWRDEHSTSKYIDIILKAKRYIDIHYADFSLTLKKVADQVYLSPNHFSTVFSQECGVTFIEYLTKTRIEKSKILLRTTNKRSVDIALETGFSDPHYFSFLFKKHTGLSPREYRTLESGVN